MEKYYYSSAYLCALCASALKFSRARCSSLRQRRGRAYGFGVSYTVFARKYRPQTFDDVVGQDHITQTLKNAIEQKRLAHAYIFVGPRGTGKTSTARILAKALNCKTGPTVSPCGRPSLRCLRAASRRPVRTAW